MASTLNGTRAIRAAAAAYQIEASEEMRLPASVRSGRHRA